MGLHRPYIRQDVREIVEERAEKNEKGQFLDANTHEPIEGQYDLGHVAGHEHWREVERAEAEGLSQEEFNDRMNNPDFYQIEDPHENRSHAHEMPADMEREDYLGKAQDGMTSERNEDRSEYLGSAEENAAAPGNDCGENNSSEVSQGME